MGFWIYYGPCCNCMIVYPTTRISNSSSSQRTAMAVSREPRGVSGTRSAGVKTFFIWNWISHYLMQRCVGHAAWVPNGHEGQSQAGPKGRQLEVGAQRAPRLLVIHIGSWTTWQMAQQAWWIVFFNSGSYCSNICSSKQKLSWAKLTTGACKHVVNGPPTYKQLTI